MLTPEMIAESQKLNVFGFALDMQTSALQDKFSLGIAVQLQALKTWIQSLNYYKSLSISWVDYWVALLMKWMESLNS